jgi:hypothetical protein
MNRCTNLIAVVIVGMALGGCGNGVVSDLPLVVVDGAPAIPPYDPGGVSIDVPDEITALGAKGSRLLIGTKSTVYGLGDVVGTLEEVSVWSDDPSITAKTGAVHAVGRRSANVLIAADNGIFHTSGDKLLVSPASAELTALGITALAAENSASGERIWFATTSGLYELEGNTLSKWTVEDEAGSPTAIATSGQLVFVAYGDRLFELNVETEEAGLVPHSFGTIHSIALFRTWCRWRLYAIYAFGWRDSGRSVRGDIRSEKGNVRADFSGNRPGRAWENAGRRNAIAQYFGRYDDSGGGGRRYWKHLVWRRKQARRFEIGLDAHVRYRCCSGVSNVLWLLSSRRSELFSSHQAG